MDVARCVAICGGRMSFKFKIGTLVQKVETPKRDTVSSYWAITQRRINVETSTIIVRIVEVDYEESLHLNDYHEHLPGGELRSCYQPPQHRVHLGHHWKVRRRWFQKWSPEDSL
jgi:hypothetical protein